MVAPNGARRSKADHPALPVTDAEIVEAAELCHVAGAHAAHLHVRDLAGNHILDADRYIGLLDAVSLRCPNLIVQITTEAVGRYTPAEQRALIDEVKPAAVSIAFKELFATPAELAKNSAFIERTIAQGTAIQWIVYSAKELESLARYFAANVSLKVQSLLFVLGRYHPEQDSQPRHIMAFVAEYEKHSVFRNVPWMVCAFGRGETASLAAALTFEGDVRVGFENSLWNADGTLAANNADRVQRMVHLAQQLGLTPATKEEARDRLGLPMI